MKKFVFVLIVITTLTACGSSKNMGKLVGVDRDEHDCIGSAGYTWSDALHQCIRIWEVGERFEAGQKNIFLVFDGDSAYAEIFTDTNKILCKRDKTQHNLWLSRKGTENVRINNGVTSVFVKNYTYTKSTQK